jgi:hypothetical protein
MKTLLHVLFIFLLSCCTLNCSFAQGHTNSKPYLKENSDVPPFKYPCKTSFKEIGHYIKSKITIEIFLAAPKYDFSNKACMFSLMEYLHNIVPDSGIINQDVYILDTATIKIISDRDLLDNPNVRKKVVALYRFNTKTGKNSFEFDPFNYGYTEKPTK